MSLFDKFKKKNKPQKEKVFEDYFMELQSDMVSICLEYVENNADKIYIYASFESNVVSCSYFYKVNGKVLEPHKLNDAGNGVTYDVSLERQRDCLHIMIDDMMKLIQLCKEHDKPMPTEMKMIYDVNTKKFDADYAYELMYSNHKTKTADTVSDAWYEEVKNNEEHTANARTVKP